MTINDIQLEKHFEAMLHECAIEGGCHVVPLPDDCKIGLAAGNVGCKAKRKPYDFGVCYQGHYAAVECKLVKGKTLYGNKIEQHQHKGLREVIKAGGLGILAVHFMFKEKGVVTRSSIFFNYRRWCNLDNPPDFSYDDFKGHDWERFDHRVLDINSSTLPSLLGTHRR